MPVAAFGGVAGDAERFVRGSQGQPEMAFEQRESEMSSTDTKRTTTVRVHPDSVLVFSPHRRGFTSHRVEEGQNLVLVISIEEAQPGTSTLLAYQAALEIKGRPPTGRDLHCGEWLVKAIYRYGDYNVQFESITCTGTMRIDGYGDGGAMQGKIDLVFSSPTIDLFGSRIAPLKLEFSEG